MSALSRSTATENENIQNTYGCDFNTNSIYPVLHNHTFFEFTFFFARTKHFINGKTVWQEKDTLIFVRPSDTHYLSDCQESLGHLNIKISCEHLKVICDYIDEDFYSLLTEADDSALSITVTPDFRRQVRKFLDELLTTKSTQTRGSACKLMVCDFLQLFYRNFYDSLKPDFSPIVKSVVSILRNSDNFSANTTDLLSNLGYSYMQIYRLFKDATGQTPNAFFMEQKLHYAENLLTYTQYKIVEIASLCGFSTQSRFDTAFKNHYGMTPREYRNKQSRLY